jgi:hypothetical protein
MSSIDTVDYTIGDELEPLQLWWTANGQLVDLSVAHTYSAKLAIASDTVTPPTNVFGSAKTTGFTGAAGSGTKGNGVPNLAVVWATTGELNTPTLAGLYLLQIVATRTSDSRQRTGMVHINLGTRF